MSAAKKGFTLIELLVVIAIIAVLMGILMPALTKVKEQAMAIACQGNLKGYALATAMYNQDSDGKFVDARFSYFSQMQPYPGETAQGSYSIRHQRWYNSQVNLLKHPEYGSEFFKLLADAKALICPSFKRLAKSKGATISDTVSWEGVQDDQFYEPWHNYTQNAYLGPEAAQALVAKVSQVKNPSTVFVYADEGPYREQGYNTSGLNDTVLWVIGVANYDLPRNAIRQFGHKDNVKPGPGAYGTFVDIIAGFHNAPSSSVTGGKGNCAFVDGHVAPVLRDDAFSVAWPQ
ncbi:MAG: type II secretion system protein [Planctomycetes bacterium]|nr:type II secretion system protein [Planctomycetota bacterium]